MSGAISYCTAADGARIAFWTCGEGTRLVVTPYHVWSNIRFEWEDPGQRAIYDHLAHQLMVVRYDRRGTGMSDRTRLELTAETELLDLQAVIEAVAGDSPIILLARAFSSPTAIRYAATHPERISHLAFYDGMLSISMRNRSPSMAAQIAVYRQLRQQDPVAAVRFIARLVRGADPDWLTSFALASAEPTYLDLYLDFENDASALAPQVSAPALILEECWSGERSNDAQALCAALPNASLVAVNRWDEDPWPDWADITPQLYDFVGLRQPAIDGGGPVTTVLFTDLVGHTEMMRRLGDDRGREVLREHERITRELLKQYGGAEVKTMGDGFMASFASVTKAMDCAIALQRAFASHTESMPEPLLVRVGLNAGEPIEEDGDLFGSTVIMASRIAAKAGAGEILIPEPLRHLLSGKSYVYTDRGEALLNGFEDAVRIFEVRWLD